MASTPARNEEKREKVSLSRSEEFLSRISTELTNEALFIARSHMNPLPTKEKQTKDQGTQISRHGEPLLLTTVSRDQSITLFQPQCSSPRPEAQTPAVTETTPALRHTFCHPLEKREHFPAA